MLLVFPDGVGIKNYLYSDAFQSLTDDLLMFHNFGADTLNYLRTVTTIADDFVIPDYKESVKEKFLRELISLTRLQNNILITGNQSLFENWRPQKKTLGLKLFYKSVSLASHFIKDYSKILKSERHYEKAIRQNPFYESIKLILKKSQPNLVFCCHQRGLKMATIFAAAKDLKIPTVTVIYSWDNLPKARLALRADKYLVWSEYMQNELRTYYPEISLSNIVITGTPQFEFYSNQEYIIEKFEFYKRYKLDLNKKIICFSGDDARTSPDDPKYLEDLASELIHSGLDKEFQILFRRAPVDNSGRYDAVIGRYHELIKEAPPLWQVNKGQGWNTAFPLTDDINLLVSIAYYSDVVINIGSTMAFDFSIFKKPCIFINYDQQQQSDKNWSVRTIYEFQHFRSMPDKNAVFWLNDIKQIGELLTRAIDSNSNTSIEKWRNIILGDYVGSSGKIKKIIHNL